MTRRGLVLGAILAAGVLAAVAAQQPPLGKIEKMADGLYRIPGQGGATAVYLAGNGVVLVDTKLANNGQGILDQVKTVTDKPVTMIINTHTHGDHVGSNMFFPGSVEIVARRTRRRTWRRCRSTRMPPTRTACPTGPSRID
jgi:glyoxylase-like metal-dependent hydrolase (beta-lactamase superfamily II)